MICPQCKCEYIRGVTECADCGVPLVDSLEPSQSDGFDNARLVPAWTGRDTAESERVKEALESAGIPFTAPEAKSSFSFLPTEPSLEIWIAESDQKEARKVISELKGRIDPEELTPEEIESLSLPEGDESEDHVEPAGPRGDLPEYWHEDGAVAEVWSGDSEEFADTLIACLREIGIPSHKHGDPVRWSLVVPEEQEPRAREIIREVVEASPPE